MLPLGQWCPGKERTVSNIFVCEHRGYAITINCNGRFLAEVPSLRNDDTIHHISEKTLDDAKAAIDAKIGADKRKPINIPVTVVGLDDGRKYSANRRPERVVDGTLIGINASSGKFRVKDKDATHQFTSNYGKCQVILQDDPERDAILAAFRKMNDADKAAREATDAFRAAIKGHVIEGGGYGTNSHNVIEKERALVEKAESLRASWAKTGKAKKKGKGK